MSRFEKKIVAAMLLIAVIPFVASYILVGQVIRASNRVAAGQTKRMQQPLETSANAYRALFAANKEIFQLRIAVLASDEHLAKANAAVDEQALSDRLGALVKQDDALQQLTLRAAMLPSAIRAGKATESRDTRSLTVAAALPGGAGHLEAIFVAPSAPFEEFQTLDKMQQETSGFSLLREELATLYRVTFVSLFAVVMLVALALALWIARRTTRRVSDVVLATRRIAKGDLESGIRVKTNDELGELATAFNEMVRQLRENRERIGYLEKIGAWQEIARRLAHQIKNPLTPIQLAVQELVPRYQKNKESFDEALNEANDIVTEEVAELRRLVNAFSAFAKLPSVQPETTDIKAFLEDFFRSHSELVQKARLHWRPHASSISVNMDRMLMKHVLFNIIDNATQAAAAASMSDRLVVELVVEVPRETREVTLVIKDNGPGIASDAVAHVFDPYFTTKQDGTGLGLAIAKKIVLEHHGTIEVTSSPGEGTQFRIALPV